MTRRSPLETVMAYIEAYNTGDDHAVLSVCDESIYVTHHNRHDFGARGKSALREVLARSKRIMPDKQFTNRRGVYVDGDTVLIEHTCGGTAREPVPGYVERGQKVSLDLCTRFTVRDGLITEYHDYG